MKEYIGVNRLGIPYT